MLGRGGSHGPPSSEVCEDMERTDWLDKGFDASDARFLMVTAISHHRFRSPTWGEGEIQKLQAELVEIDRAAEQAVIGQAKR